MAALPPLHRMLIGFAAVVPAMVSGCRSPQVSEPAEPQVPEWATARPVMGERPPAQNGSTSAPAADAAAPAPTPADSGRPEIVSTTLDARPAAIFGGRAIDWGDLQPILSETAGAIALEEVVLDRMLDDLLRQRDLTIDEDDMAAERTVLIRSLHRDPDTALRLLRELRRRRGLGPRRFDALLRRNAALRALVHDDVQVTDAAVQRMYERRYGPRRQARLITVPTLADAERAIDRIEAGESFSDVAVMTSTDVSAARGGLLEPISRADPSYPQVLREALWALEPDAVSSPILLDNGYALLRLESEQIEEAPPLESVRDELVEQVRRSQERLAMDELARRLLRDVRITIFDPSLEASWSARHGESQPR